MKQYEDRKTGAIKYDLYFSDKQIKTGFSQNGEHVPFRHNRLIDSKTGEPMLLYRIMLRDPQHRNYQFRDPKLNSGPVFIQIPAASVTRKVKGMTSVYTVTTPYKDSWRMMVYSGDINAKDGWRGPSEKISLDVLAQCLEHQSKEHEQTAEEKIPDSDIDSFFPKEDQPVQTSPSQENKIPEQDKEPDQAEEAPSAETRSPEKKDERIAQLESLVALQQAEINGLKEQIASLTDIAKSIDQRTEGFADQIGQISKDHKALIDIYARIKDWSRNMLGKYTNLEYTVDSVRSEVSRISEMLKGKDRSPKITYKNR